MRNLNVDLLKKDIFGDNDKDNPFEIAVINSDGVDDTPETNNLEKIIKEICRLKSSARVVQNDNKYSLEIIFEKLPAIKNNISISPLLSKKEHELTNTVTFTDLQMLQLSEFYIIEASNGDESVRRVIKIKTDNIPNIRESALVNSIVKDKHGFVQYITFL